MKPKIKLRTIKVSDLGTIITGHTPSRKIPEYFGDSHTWIKPTDIEIGKRYVKHPEEKFSNKAYEKYKNSLLPKNSTCVVTIGTVGEKICLTTEPSFTNQAINAIIPNTEEFDPLFVYYLMKNNLYLVEQRNSGTASGRQNISKSDFSNIKLQVPEIVEQRIIGNILSKFDELLEINEEKIFQIDEITKILFNEWFVKYKIPFYNNKDNSLEETIPKGWEKTTLGDIVTFVRGKKAKEIHENESENTTPYILIDGIKNDSHLHTSDPSGVYAIKRDILMVMDGASSGTVFIGQQGFVGSTFAALKIKDSSISPYYIMLYLLRNFDKILSNNTGTAIPHANKNFIKKMEIVIPKNDDRAQLFEIFEHLYTLRFNILSKNKLLLSTRDLLIEKLISGSINVISLNSKHGEKNE